MSETKHTPGPWRLDTWNGWLLSAEDVGIVKFDMNRTLLADAKLIAAAPELLAACELALLDMDSWQISGPGRKAIEAAIKKAKGE
jgi:hypothetical protein